MGAHSLAYYSRHMRDMPNERPMSARWAPKIRIGAKLTRAQNFIFDFAIGPFGPGDRHATDIRHGRWLGGLLVSDQWPP